MSIRVIGAVILALLLDERGLGNTLTLVYGPIRPWVSGIAPDPRRPGPSGLPIYHPSEILAAWNVDVVGDLRL
jgi:hypothetical protein